MASHHLPPRLQVTSRRHLHRLPISSNGKTSALRQQMGLVILSLRILLRQAMHATCRSSCRGAFAQLRIASYLYAQKSTECITLADGFTEIPNYPLPPPLTRRLALETPVTPRAAAPTAS